jgi:hypothetical protein
VAQAAARQDHADRAGHPAPRLPASRHGRRQRRLRLHHLPVDLGGHRPARRPRPPPGPRPRHDQETGPGGRAARRPLIPTCRRSGTANRANYNGKHKKHGLLFLALTDEAGNLAWISSARRGAASKVTAARHDHIAARLRAAGLAALADLGFTGLDPDPEDPVIITGYKSTRTSKTTPAQRHANQALSAARAPVEHGFSDLKNWRILTRLRLAPGKATTVLRALLVLTRQHTTR